MHWSLFVLAGIGLLLAHGLKLPLGGSRAGALGAFLVGLLGSVIAIKMLAASTGVGRTTDFDRFVNAAVDQAEQDPAPLIVFTGASYSRNGIDPERLTLALRERGYDYQVVSLSIEAASILERDAHLRQFIELSDRVPDHVFVEVAEDFDHRAAYMFGNSKFNNRAIEQFDLANTTWTSLGLLGGACEGAKECLTDIAFLGLHGALNFLNIGLIGAAEDPETAGSEPAYDPQYVPRTESDPSLAATSLKEDPRHGPQWVRSFRAQQRDQLQSLGVKAVSYYQPPVLEPSARAYVTGLCQGELADHVCISPDAPALMMQLNGDHWFDPSHLLDSGTAIYNAWLLEEVIASGLLEASS